MKSIAILGLVAVAGCTTTSQMNVVDLNYYQIDCARREEQLAFLQRQMPTRQDRLVNGLRMTSVVGNVVSATDGTYYEERATFDRRQEAIARLIIYQIQAYCPPAVQSAQGCTHINESLPSGSTQAALCYQNRQTTPVVKRWEVIAQ